MGKETENGAYKIVTYGNEKVANIVFIPKNERCPLDNSTKLIIDIIKNKAISTVKEKHKNHGATKIPTRRIG